jgi:hypothetical protein
MRWPAQDVRTSTRSTSRYDAKEDAGAIDEVAFLEFDPESDRLVTIVPAGEGVGSERLVANGPMPSWWTRPEPTSPGAVGVQPTDAPFGASARRPRCTRSAWRQHR